MTTASINQPLRTCENNGSISVSNAFNAKDILIEEINSAILIQSLHNLVPEDRSTDEIIQLHFSLDSGHSNYCLGINYYPMLIGHLSNGVRKCH